jgi:hypothetical protein
VVGRCLNARVDGPLGPFEEGFGGKRSKGVFEARDDAAMTALKPVAKNPIEKHLLNAKGQPNFGLTFYCLNAKGEYGGVAMYESTYAVCAEHDPQTLKTDALFDGRATDDARRMHGQVHRSVTARQFRR